MSRENRCIICYKKWSGQHDLLSFHSFPEDKEIKEKWVDFCISCGCLTKNDYVGDLKICSAHFAQSVYEGTKCAERNLQLKEGAVPSMYGGCPHKENSHPSDYVQYLPLGNGKFTNSIGSIDQTYNETNVNVNQKLRKMPPHSGNGSYTKCCVSVCDSRDQNANFYKFPQRVMLINMWKSALQIFRSQMVTNLCVCEQHFDQRDFLPGTKMLRKLAIPSIVRNDKKLNLQVEKNSGQCSCQCTRGNRQDKPKESMVQSTHDDHLPVAIASPKQYSINRLKAFEDSEINKDNAIVIYDQSARIVITSDNSSLRLKIAQQVGKILRDNISENVLTVYEVDTVPNLEKNVREEVISLSDLEEDTDAIAKETTPISDFKLKAPSHSKLHGKISLMKYKEMTKKFGTKCPYCGYRDVDMLYHIRRIHYGMFPEGPISDETIYEELLNQMETFDKDEEEFPSRYLNANYKITCQYCREDFPNVVALIIHVKGVHETTCGPLPLTENQLKSGMRNCKFCNRILNSLDEYNLHISRCIFNPVSRGYNEPQICEVCGQTGTRDQIKAHRLRTHCNEDREKFICEICGRALSNTTYYKYHLLRHENKRRLRCRVEGCEKFFNTPACLQKHHATHLPPEAWKFACNICGKKFRNKFVLLKHVESHSIDRHQCLACGKIVQGKSAMQVHVSKFHRSGRNIFWIDAPTRERRLTMGGNRSSEGKRGTQRMSELQQSRKSRISQEEYYDLQEDGLEEEEGLQSSHQNIKRSKGSSGLSGDSNGDNVSGRN